MISLASYSDQTVFYNKAFMLQSLLQGGHTLLPQDNKTSAIGYKEKKDKIHCKIP